MSKEPNRNVYVGHRYVPKIMGEWDNKIDYEGLSIVTYQGTSYTSKKRVPVGIDILNEEFWVVTGNYNAQVDYYRDETERVAQALDSKSEQTYVDTELGKKADTSFVNTELGKKADTSFVNTELDKKADTSFVNNELGKKADTSFVDSELDTVNDRLSHTDNIYDVKSFGALGDGSTDDTQAIKDTLNAMSRGDKIIFPAGNYLTKETIVINKNIDVDMRGVIVADHQNISIDVNGLGTGEPYIPNIRLKTTKKSLDHSDNSVGVRINNVYGIQLRLDYIVGFTTNALFYSENGRGTVYNEVSLGQLHNGKTQIELNQSADGWTNQNTFIGGRLYYGRLASRSGYVQIKINGENYRPNGNMFINTSVEDIGTDTGDMSLAVDCEGLFNTFHNIRTEGSMEWLLRPRSYRNEIHGGVYIYSNNIDDQGTFNKIVTTGTGSKSTTQTSPHEFIAGANGTVGIVARGNGATRVPARFYNQGGGLNPALQIMEGNGEDVAVELNSHGSWTVKNGTRKVHFGTHVTHPSTGTRGDISFITNPSSTAPVGYVCLTNDGTIWKPFGMQASSHDDVSPSSSLETLITEYNQLLAKLRSAKIIRE